MVDVSQQSKNIAATRDIICWNWDHIKPSTFENKFVFIYLIFDQIKAKK